MLSEIWDFITTKSTVQARKEGYLYHAIALSHRARRCKKYWQRHLENCHQQIKKIPNGDRIVIFGSGLLLETPLEILTEKYNWITLVDAVHTKEVRAQIKNSQQISHKKIELVEMDLNKEIYEGKCDYYISANILSQIGFVTTQDWIKKNKSEKEIDKMNQELQARHLDQLTRVASKGLLFSDYKMEILDLSSHVIEERLTVSEKLKIHWQDSWGWDLAPAPELSKDYSVRLTVGCDQTASY